MNDPKEIEIKLVGRSEVGQFNKAEDALTSVEKQADKTTKAIEKTNAAVSKLASSSDLQKALSANPSLAKLNPSLLSQPERLGPDLPSVAERNAAIAEAYAKRNAERKNFTDAEAAAAAGIQGGVSTGARAAVGATAVAAAGVAAVTAASIEQYAKAQDAVAGLNAALAQNGILTEKTSSEYQELASKLSLATAIPVQKWEEALATLTQFGAREDNINQTSEAVKNLAGIMRGDIQHAANLMGRALEGDFSQLHRYGISVNQAQTDTEKLQSVMQQAAALGGGQLEVRAATLSGQFKNLETAAGKVFQAFGGMIARTGVLQSILGTAESMFLALAKRMGATIPVTDGLNNVLAINSRRLAEVQANASAAAREYESIRAVSQRLTEQLNRQATAQQAILRAQDEVASSELALRIAQIDSREHSGAISSDAAEVQRAMVRRQFEVEQFRRHQAADQETISANERRLNQFGFQRGFYESERTAAEAELQRQREGHAARAALANAELERQRAEQAEAHLQGPAILPLVLAGGEGGRALAQAQAEAAARTQAAIRSQGEAQTRVDRFSGTTEQGLAAAIARFATASQNFSDAVTEERNHRDPLNDAISNARIAIDARAARFGIDTRRENIETTDRLGQIGQRNIGPAQQQMGVEFSRQLELQNQAWIQFFQDLMQGLSSADRERMSAIDRDVRNLQSQIRSLNARQ